MAAALNYVGLQLAVAGCLLHVRVRTRVCVGGCPAVFGEGGSAVSSHPVVKARLGGVSRQAGLLLEFFIGFFLFHDLSGMAFGLRACGRSGHQCRALISCWGKELSRQASIWGGWLMFCFVLLLGCPLLTASYATGSLAIGWG